MPRKKNKFENAHELTCRSGSKTGLGTSSSTSSSFASLHGTAEEPCRGKGCKKLRRVFSKS